jgi:hypothetical protein
MKQQDVLDEAIERVMVRDAKKLPLFATSPDSPLTAKLAISIASKGMLSTLAAKLALFGGIGLVGAIAAYYWAADNSAPVDASLRTAPTSNTITTPASPSVPKLQSPQPVVAVSTAPGDTTRTPSTPVRNSQAIAKPQASSAIKSLDSVAATVQPVLDNRKDTTAIPHIENEHYQPPLK